MAVQTIEARVGGQEALGDRERLREEREDDRLKADDQRQRRVHQRVDIESHIPALLRAGQQPQRDECADEHEQGPRIQE